MTMAEHPHIDFDRLMRDLMLVGFGALLMWTLTGVVGFVSGQYGIEPQATLRFLLSVLMLVFARRTYWEICEWRWKRTPADDRFGFSSPLWENPRLTFEARQRHGTDEEPPQAQG
jgi:hypothetical protein